MDNAIDVTVSERPLLRRLAAILLMLAGTLAVQGQAAIVLLLSERFNVIEIVCARYLSAIIVVSVATALIRPPFGSLHLKQYIQISGVAASNALTIVLIFVSYTLIPVNDSTALRLLSPFFAAILARLFLAERFGRIVAFAFVLSFVGVLLVTRPPVMFDAATTQRFVGCAVTLGAAFAYGLMYVMMRSLALVHPMVVVFGTTLPCAAVCVVVYVGMFVAGLGSAMGEFSAYDGILLASLGAVSSFSLFCFSLAAQYEKAAICSMLSATEIVWAFLLQALFRNGFHLLSLLGATLIGVGVVLVGMEKLAATSPELPTLGAGIS